MDQIPKLTILFLSLLVSSCSNNTLKPKQELEEATSPIDTNFIQNEILQSFVVVDTFYNEAIKQNDTISFHPAWVACKLKLNADEYLDYFVIADYTGGPTSGYFFDGKTGLQISQTEAYEVILSRPGVDIEYEVVDVNCGDQIQELLLRTGGGGTIGSSYNCAIYRFDVVSNSIKTIFQEAITTLEWKDDMVTEEILEVNYINVNYDKQLCFDTIKVWEGSMVNPENPYSLDILPLESKLMAKWIFNSTINTFE